jgi:dihydrofolate reductase
MDSPHLWHPAYVSEESLAMLADQLDDATAMLLGRQTYEDFAGYWPHQSSDVPLADATNGIRKYVVSRTLSTAAR